MGNLFVRLLCSIFLVGALGTAEAEAAELEKNAEIPTNIASEGEEFYYVIDDPVPQLNSHSRTWSKTTSSSITKGTRVYLGTETRSRNTGISVTVAVGPTTVKVEHNVSASGRFKKYRQNVTIKVAYKRYRKADNKYIDTKTAVANTSYISYVPI